MALIGSIGVGNSGGGSEKGEWLDGETTGQERRRGQQQKGRDGRRRRRRGRKLAETDTRTHARTTHHALPNGRVQYWSWSLVLTLND